MTAKQNINFLLWLCWKKESLPPFRYTVQPTSRELPCDNRNNVIVYVTLSTLDKSNTSIVILLSR